jgi:hypothetical protein
MVGLTRVVLTNSIEASPAAEVVSASSSKAPAKLFESETIQLTDAGLEGLAKSIHGIEMFDFADGKLSKRHAAEEKNKCKIYPGDAEWLSQDAWKLLDFLIDSALLKPTPIAAVCYSSPQWGVYDAGACANITRHWNESYLQ